MDDEEDKLPRTNLAIAHSSGPRDQIRFAIAFHVGLAARLWHAHFFDRMKGLGQSTARWAALCIISDAKVGINQTDLAEQLGVQGPTLVRLLDALEKQGLVARHSVQNDRRIRNISIETKGRETLVEIDRFASTMRAQLFEGVSEADLDATLRVLRHLTDQLEPRVPAN